MMNSQNSRRNFLSSMAILSAGTVIAGSPASLFATDGIEQANPETTWKAYLKVADASMYFNLVGINLAVVNNAVKGHDIKKGDIVSFESEGLLAQPTWIYWGNNFTRPSDVLINVYENKYPYQRVGTINRYELEALVQLSQKDTKENFLLASCVKGGLANKFASRLMVHTRILKAKRNQDVSFYKNNSLVLTQKLFSNA